MPLSMPSFFKGRQCRNHFQPLRTEPERNIPGFKDKFIAIENISSKKLIDKMADEFYPEEYKGIEDKTIILSIGRLVEQKGFDLAVKAAKT